MAKFTMLCFAEVFQQIMTGIVHVIQVKLHYILLFTASSTNGTPIKAKGQMSQDDEPAGLRIRQGRKTTEEEEGEIFSDLSDSESKKVEKRRRHSSSKSHDTEEVGINRDSLSEQSDSESKRAEKRRKYSSSRSADTDDRQKEKENISDPSDSEDVKLDQRIKYSSPKNPDSDSKAARLSEQTRKDEGEFIKNLCNHATRYIM